MRKVLSIIAIMLLMSIGSLDANPNRQKNTNYVKIDECAGLATSLALQYATPEFPYWSVWFAVYGACNNDQPFL